MKSDKKIFTVTDLGPGDGGKGGVVHKICHSQKPHTVIKVGGAQGSHGVKTSSGFSFNFSQFGCGTFDGTRTHISELMIFEPYRLFEEGNMLKNNFRISQVFELVTIHEDALCSTPFHNFSSQLRELLRKDNPRGTVGVGIGDALRDSIDFPESAIYARDLGNKSVLRKKLEAIRCRKIEQFDFIFSNDYEKFFLTEDCEKVIELRELFEDNDFIDRIIKCFVELSKTVSIINADDFKKQILDRDGIIVVESSHGILTDRFFGFHPHTSFLRTLPQFTLDLLKAYDYDGDIVKLAVHRAYQIRHGAGPMVTESASMHDALLPGSNKDENRWQGKVRIGPLDLVMLRYALDVCGDGFFDGIAVTWFDQVQSMSVFNFTDHYQDSETQFRNITVKRYDQFEDQILYQEQLTKMLYKANPVIQSLNISGDGLKQCCDFFQEKLNLPVSMISFGPTEKHKKLF